MLRRRNGALTVSMLLAFPPLNRCLCAVLLWVRRSCYLISNDARQASHIIDASHDKFLLDLLGAQSGLMKCSHCTQLSFLVPSGSSNVRLQCCLGRRVCDMSIIHIIPFKELVRIY